MKIGNNSYVSIAYKLSLDSGEEIDQSTKEQPLSFVWGTGQIIPAVEGALDGQEEGASVTLKVPPEDGYGVRQEALERELPRNAFPEDAELNPGQVFEASGPHGPIPFRVVSVTDEVVKGDFNHPLAGESLNFEIDVVGVREATPEEVTAATAPPPASCGCGCGHEDDCSDGCDDGCG